MNGMTTEQKLEAALAELQKAQTHSVTLSLLGQELLLAVQSKWPKPWQESSPARKFEIVVSNPDCGSALLARVAAGNELAKLVALAEGQIHGYASHRKELFNLAQRLLSGATENAMVKELEQAKQLLAAIDDDTGDGEKLLTELQTLRAREQRLNEWLEEKTSRKFMKAFEGESRAYRNVQNFLKEI